MSGFEGDPFGPVDNPFEDPAVKEVAKQTTSVQRGLEDYNPFENQGSSQNDRPTLTYEGETQPAVMQPTQENVPSFSKNPTLTPLDFQKRQEELEKREQAIRKREEQLRNVSYNVRRNNWPPLPSNMCGLEPCFYQDINVEIPVDFQGVVKQLYHLWLFHTILMVANVFGTLAYSIYDIKQLTQFLLAVFYLLIFTPFSFLCWYRPGYKAFRDDSSTNFMVFFFIFFFQLVICILQALGSLDGGICGIILAISIFTHNTGAGSIIVGIIVLSIACGFCAAAAMDMFLLTKVHRIYRSSGASMVKARDEISNNFFNNPHVREAASATAAAALQSQLSPNSQPTSYRT